MFKYTKKNQYGIVFKNSDIYDEKILKRCNDFEVLYDEICKKLKILKENNNFQNEIIITTLNELKLKIEH